MPGKHLPCFLKSADQLRLLIWANNFNGLAKLRMLTIDLNGGYDLIMVEAISQIGILILAQE